MRIVFDSVAYYSIFSGNQVLANVSVTFSSILCAFSPRGEKTHPSGLYMGVIKMWGYDKKSLRKFTNCGNTKQWCLIYVCAFQHLMMSSLVLWGEKHSYFDANEKTNTNKCASLVDHQISHRSRRLDYSNVWTNMSFSSLFTAFLFSLLPCLFMQSIILFQRWSRPYCQTAASSPLKQKSSAVET